MVTQETITALKRFAMGPRPGDAEVLEGQVRDWLVAQCDDPSAALLTGEGLLDTVGWMQRLADYRGRLKEEKQRLTAMKSDNGSAMSMDAKSAEEDALKAFRKQNPANKAYQLEAEARVSRAVATPAPFVERLVTFWSDHFCVSIKKGGKVRVAAGAYEREAIRPHVLGKFSDMLQASVRHPAMLLYLDNARSRGPNSRAGLRSGRGLNENHGREILELHTLGVDGGYSQDDVINLARILTGWTVAGPRSARNGEFLFLPAWHEPGTFTLLGKRYRGDGIDQGRAALDDLARHPSTARHIARKLVRYFGPGTPMPEVERMLARRFQETDGDLAEVSRALLKADALWNAPAEKLLSPYEMVVATARALDWRPSGRNISRVLNALGQPLWGPSAPAGWPDEADTWLAADALLERVDWAEGIAAEQMLDDDVLLLADSLFGDTLSEYTLRAMARADSRKQAVAMLLMSPEFQRR